MTTPTVDDLSHEIDLTVDRLRHLGAIRLATPITGAVTAAEAVHALSQELADAAADLSVERPAEVPRLGDHAAADQLAVVGRELLDAIAGRPDRDRVSTLAGRVRALRLALP